MIKVMHVDTVFEVFIFNFFYFGYFFYARRGTYLMMVNFLKTLKPPISGESSTKMSYLGPPHTNTRSYGIKRWNTMRKKKLFLAPPIPPWSRWPSDSGKLRGSKNKCFFLIVFQRLMHATQCHPCSRRSSTGAYQMMWASRTSWSWTSAWSSRWRRRSRRW